MYNLAIIIPAFKEKYFRLALNSLASQTDKRFTVYIGDDHSPFNLASIVDEFDEKMSIKYVRFSDNIGAKNLVYQWARCIELSKDEEWIWLFSDDDIADHNCVEKFYQTIDKNKCDFDVYRFNTTVIDQNGTITSESIKGPNVESSVEMAYHLLLRQRGNSMPDHIFSRKVYVNTGGFVYTQYAQAADWATSIKFSKERGMCIIPEAKLFWRYSGSNISSLASANKVEMARGHFEFIKWILNHFQYLEQDLNCKICYYDIKMAALENLKNVMHSHYKGFNVKMFFPIFKLLRKHFNISFLNSFKLLYRMR